MSFYRKALKYREQLLTGEYSENSKAGLLNRAITHLRKHNVKNLIDKKTSIFFPKRDTLSEIKIEKDSKIFRLFNNLSNEISTISLKKNGHIKFLEIISDYFNFDKSALLIFSHESQEFVYWHGINIDQESKDKLSLNLEYNDVYKRMVKKEHLINYSNAPKSLRIDKLLSSKDNNESNFQFFVPFIFSGYVIGIFLGLKMNKEKKPSKELIKSMQIIGKLNGALLYNILQQECFNNQENKKRTT